jgi:hypothetical protein
MTHVVAFYHPVPDGIWKALLVVDLLSSSLAHSEGIHRLLLRIST